MVDEDIERRIADCKGKEKSPVLRNNCYCPLIQVESDLSCPYLNREFTSSIKGEGTFYGCWYGRSEEMKLPATSIGYFKPLLERTAGLPKKKLH